MNKIRIDVLTKQILLNRVQTLKMIIPQGAFLELYQLFEELLSQEIVDTEEITKILILLDSIEGTIKDNRSNTRNKQKEDNCKKRETNETNKKIIQLGLLSNHTAFLCSEEIFTIKKALINLAGENENHRNRSQKKMKKI